MSNIPKHDMIAPRTVSDINRKMASGGYGSGQETKIQQVMSKLNEISNDVAELKKAIEKIAELEERIATLEEANQTTE